jgi:carboxyl-terminal processing protease
VARLGVRSIRLLLAAGLLLGTARAASCPDPDTLGADPPGVTLNRTQRSAVLDAFVTVVRERALDPDFGSGWLSRARNAGETLLNAPDDRTFFRAARGLANTALDDHFAFLSPADLGAWESDGPEARPYGGIGVTGRGDPTGALRIDTVRPDSPAARAALGPGDRIVRVDGACPSVEAVRGAVGTGVRLDVVTAGGARRDLTLIRAAQDAWGGLRRARLASAPDVGYLRFDSFDPDGIGAHLHSELLLLGTDADGRPAPLSGLILDLRANGGGQPYELLRFLSVFVSGKVGEWRGRDGMSDVVVPRGYGRAVEVVRDVPIVVLVSPHTASAAEEAAAVLRRFRGARVLGQPSARLTTLATFVDLPFGTSVLVPTQEFHLLGEGPLRRTGVKPDVTLPFTPPGHPDSDAAVRAALTALGVASAGR